MSFVIIFIGIGISSVLCSLATYGCTKRQYNNKIKSFESRLKIKNEKIEELNDDINMRISSYSELHRENIKLQENLKLELDKKTIEQYDIKELIGLLPYIHNQLNNTIDILKLDIEDLNEELRFQANWGDSLKS